MIKRCRKHVEEKMSNASQSPATDSETENKEEEKKIHHLVLPYMGKKGAKIAKMLKRKIIQTFDILIDQGPDQGHALQQLGL